MDEMRKDFDELMNELGRKLKEKGISPFDMIGVLLSGLSITHIPVGLNAGTNTNYLSIYPGMEADLQLSGKDTPRSLIEALCLRMTAQFRLEGLNANQLPSERRSGIPLFETWVWLIQGFIDACERHGMRSRLAIEQNNQRSSD